MADTIAVDCDDLKGLQDGYGEASSGFVEAKSAFNDGADPGFGFILQGFKSKYTSAKQQTAEYLDNIGNALSYIRGGLDETISIFENGEESNLDQISELEQRVDDLEARVERLEHQGNDGDDSGSGSSTQYGSVDGGFGGGFGGGGFGGFSGGGASVDSAMPVSSTVPDMPESTDMPNVSGDSAQASLSDQVQGSVSADSASFGGADGDEPSTTPVEFDEPSKGTFTMPAEHMDGMNAIGIDVTGDAEDEFSLNLTDGGTHAAVDADGSIRLTKKADDTEGVPMPEGAQMKEGPTFALDADNDGIDDITLAPDASADSRISIFEDGDDRYAALDTDNDGDYDAVMRVGDSQAAHEQIQQEAESAVWEKIADRDPLGRSADELRALYEESEPLRFPEPERITV